MKPLVLYHANCWDGFCAAWVARKALRDIEAIPVQYGQDMQIDVCGRQVFILDFSYKREVMKGIIGQSHSVVVLDHHKTAQAELDFPSCTPEQMKSGEGRIYIKFDMEKSGGRLVWEYFFGDAKAPWLVYYTEDRDLWRHKLYASREINAAVRSYPFDFGIWNIWQEMSETFEGQARILTWLRDEGTAILRRERQIIDDHIRNAVEIEMDGHKVLSVNATVLFSEIAGELAKGKPFGACYFNRHDGKVQWSLRSTDEGVDVAEIAKKNGGGGHRNAAGFEATL